MLVQNGAKYGGGYFDNHNILCSEKLTFWIGIPLDCYSRSATAAITICGVVF